MPDREQGDGWPAYRRSFEQMEEDVKMCKDKIENLNIKLVLLAATIIAGNQGLSILINLFRH